MREAHRNGDALVRQHWSDRIQVPEEFSIDRIFGSPDEEASVVVQAVCWMREANLGYNPPNERENFKTWRQVQTYKLFSKWQSWFTLTNVMYFMVGFFEIPAWCGKKCPEDKEIPMMNRHYWREEFLIPFEMCLLSVYMLRLWMRREIFEHARSRFLYNWRILSCVCVAMSLASIIISPLLGHKSKIHRLLRVPIFLSFTKGLRSTLTRVLVSLPESATAFSMVFGTIYFFSWIGMVLFDFTPANEPFMNLLVALKHMYVTMTTDNMPNVMLPCIEYHASMSFFFIIFLTLSLHLLMNVLLADQYNAYRKQLMNGLIELYTNRQKSVDFAYGLVLEHEGGDEGIGVETLATFLDELIGPAASAHAAGVFEILDTDGGGRLEIDEFRLVAEVLGDPNFTVYDNDVGGVKWLKPIEPIVEKYDKFCDFFAVAGFCIVLWQTTYFVSVGDEDEGVKVLCCYKSGFNISLFLISIAYAVELTLEVLLQGRVKFMDSFQNRYDMITVCTLMPLELYFFFLAGEGAPIAACRMLALLRGLRCLRTLHKFEGPRNILVKVLNGMEPFTRVLLLLFCICYMGAQVGMIVLGGLVRTDNELLASTAYADNDFWALNFNDLPSGLYFMWAHVVGANAHVWMNGFNTAFGPVAYLVAFIFDLVCRIILLNIVIALVIDCVLVPLPEQKEDEEFVWPDREDQIREMFQDSGQECMRLLTEEEKGQRSKLRELLGGE